MRAPRAALAEAQVVHDLLRLAAFHEPADGGLVFRGKTGDVRFPYSRVLAEAEALSGGLWAAGVRPGGHVLVSLPTSPQLAVTFYALLRCGARPCLLAEPLAAPALNAIARRLRARLLIAESQAVAPAELSPGLEILDPAVLRAAAGPAPAIAADPDDIAFIQATSATGDEPKCVALSHRAVLANLRQIQAAAAIGHSDVIVSWLPLHHDMGLIGVFLMLAHARAKGVLMTPSTFLRDPLAWLGAVSDHRGTLSPAPTFAYALAARRIRPEAMSGLDLSSWRGALCGAETVHAAVLRRFAARFKAVGFRSESFIPCYGLAEASLAVTLEAQGTGPRVERVAREALVGEGIARVQSRQSSRDDETVDVVGCGPPLPGTRVRVTDERGRDCADGELGDILVSGPSLMARYEGDAAKTAATLDQGWLRTGDIGYLRAGSLFVTGRAKDLVSIRGAKHPPDHFEAAATSVPGIRQGRAVAFGVPDVAEGTEGLCVLCEPEASAAARRTGLERAVAAAVARLTGVLPARVVLVAPGTIPKTTSGKLQRRRARELYLQATAARA